MINLHPNHEVFESCRDKIMDTVAIMEQIRRAADDAINSVSKLGVDMLSEVLTELETPEVASD
jgi:hypothetical protein